MQELIEKLEEFIRVNHFKLEYQDELRVAEALLTTIRFKR